MEGEEWPTTPHYPPPTAGAWRSEGYVFKIGLELEYFLVRQRDGSKVISDPLDTLEKPCYDLKGSGDSSA